ncbi:hypothetical protein GCM10010261_19110 [Streptomyces pilosus]|nr:hypothetical protein GCM10010261_19110 [Streptomyces pilosus]
MRTPGRRLPSRPGVSGRPLLIRDEVTAADVELWAAPVQLDLDGIERRHRAHCHGLEAAGTAVRILDRAAHAARCSFHRVDPR